MEQERVASARGAQAAGAGAVYRPMAGSDAAGARMQALGNRVPDAGSIARMQEVAALEREYYARALAQMRAQNWRAGGNFSRPARAAGRRR
jgi:hypothetical protein